MNYFATRFYITALLCLFILPSATVPAAALSADIANKCREMAIKEYPSKAVGTKGGNAEAQRKYFRDCILRESAEPDQTRQNSLPASSR